VSVNGMFRDGQIDSCGMAKPKKERAKPPTVSHDPLFKWFDKHPDNRAALRKAGYSDGRITNWKTRGIPRGQLAHVAEVMGLSFDQYLEAAGEKPKVATVNGLVLEPEEAEAIQSLREAMPGWRSYVLNLAMTRQDQQEMLLEVLTLPKPKPDDAPPKRKSHVISRGRLRKSGKPDADVKRLKNN